MGMTCIIAEKPSVARELAAIVGADSRENGYMEGNNYIVTWAYRPPCYSCYATTVWCGGI